MHVEVSQLNKEFYTKNGVVVALKDINMQIEKGEFVCVVGASGSGKSTLLRLIAGLDTPTGGEVLLDGVPVTEPTTACAILSESYRLSPWITVGDHVGYSLQHLSPAERTQQITDYLRIVGLSLLANSLPHELSRQMKQRVLLASALASEPKILLLDDPFYDFEDHTKEGMQQFMRRLWRQLGITILMVTRDVSEAVCLSQRIYVLTSYPGTIEKEIKINLPHSRDRTYKIKQNLTFNEYDDEVMKTPV